LISQRTKDALAAKKAQGVRLGGINAGSIRTRDEARAEWDFRSLLSFAKCWCRPGASIQSRPARRRPPPPASRLRILGIPTMRLTTLVHHAMPFVAVGAGLLVLIRPQLLNYVVAAYLILTGVVGLNGLYHFVR